jgi:hypothetical protein
MYWNIKLNIYKIYTKYISNITIRTDFFLSSYSHWWQNNVTCLYASNTISDQETEGLKISSLFFLVRQLNLQRVSLLRESFAELRPEQYRVINPASSTWLQFFEHGIWSGRHIYWLEIPPTGCSSKQRSIFVFLCILLRDFTGSWRQGLSWYSGSVVWSLRDLD